MAKSFNFEIYNPRKIYRNSPCQQDFVLYNKAMYAYINECEYLAGVDPYDDTKNGRVIGEYWVQVVNSGGGSSTDQVLEEIAAYVKAVSETDKATASVEVEDGKLAFTFGIPRGKDGKDGVDGKDGKDGVNGKDGKDGAGTTYVLPIASSTILGGIKVGSGLTISHDGVLSTTGTGGDGSPSVTPALGITKFIYCLTKTELHPERPVGGSWDYSTNSGTLPTSNYIGTTTKVDWVWSYDDDNLDGINVWMTSGTFTDKGTIDSNGWNAPIRLNGKKGDKGDSGDPGEHGTDNASIEYIFYRSKTSITWNTIPTPERIYTNLEIQSDNNLEGIWTDNPRGVDVANQFEYVSFRYTSGDDTNWHIPTLWSKYGTNGKDGAGVEYIYKVTNTGLVPELPTFDVSSVEYQKSDYVPEGWTDDPTGVSQENKYEWVCVRKFNRNTDDDYDGSWKAFEGPALWAKFGEDGISKDGKYYRKLFAVSESGVAPAFDKRGDNLGTVWSESFTGTLNWEQYTVYSIQALWGPDGQLEDWFGPFIEHAPVPVVTASNYSLPAFIITTTTDTPTLPDLSNDTVIYSTTTKDFTGDGLNGWTVDTGNIPVGSYLWTSMFYIDGDRNTVIRCSTPSRLTGSDGDNGNSGNGIVILFTQRNYDAGDGKHGDLLNEITAHNVSEIDNFVTNNADWGKETWDDADKPFTWYALGKTDSNGAITWVGAFCTTGPKGDSGPAGLTTSGLESVYTLGTATECGADATVATNTMNAEAVAALEKSADSAYKWYEYYREFKDQHVANNQTTSTSEYKYVWTMQAKTTYGTDGTPTYHWDAPFRISGIDGLAGMAKRGQIIYPAGTWNPDETYVGTDEKAPYVYHNGKYYVLNTTNALISQGDTPSADGGQHWIEMEGFKALYANVAVIENGTVGELVYNECYVFSKEGVANSSYSGSNTASYENFNPGDGGDPYNNDENPFLPNYCLNCCTGDLWTAAGKNKLSADGSGYLASENIAWDNQGKLDVWVNDRINVANDSVNFVLPKFTKGTRTTFSVPVLAGVTINVSSEDNADFYILNKLDSTGKTESYKSTSLTNVNNGTYLFCAYTSNNKNYWTIQFIKATDDGFENSKTNPQNPDKPYPSKLATTKTNFVVYVSDFGKYLESKGSSLAELFKYENLGEERDMTATITLHLFNGKTFELPNIKLFNSEATKENVSTKGYSYPYTSLDQGVEWNGHYFNKHTIDSGDLINIGVDAVTNVEYVDVQYNNIPDFLNNPKTNGQINYTMAFDPYGGVQVNEYYTGLFSKTTYNNLNTSQLASTIGSRDEYKIFIFDPSVRYQTWYISDAGDMTNTIQTAAIHSAILDSGDQIQVDEERHTGAYTFNITNSGIDVEIKWCESKKVIAYGTSGGTIISTPNNMELNIISIKTRDSSIAKCKIYNKAYIISDDEIIVKLEDLTPAITISNVVSTAIN